LYKLHNCADRIIYVIDEYINKEMKGMPSIKCKDIGMKCGFKLKDEDQEELMQILALHAEKTHNMKTIPPDVMEKLQKAIKK
jgi:predicted small metal-binding protein